jgi:23S rRNA (guanosine2251-2'-O)-methyltransferase
MPPPFKKSFSGSNRGPGPNRGGPPRGGDTGGRSRDRNQDRSGPRRPEDDGIVRLFGIHPVEAALANSARIITKVMATENAEARLADALAKRGVSVERTTPRDLDRLLGPDTVHQGVMLQTELLDEPDLDDVAERAIHGGGPVLVLDQVTDPHNVGAVLRSAAVFGAAAVIMTRRNSPPLNGTLAKSASGALELVPLLLVTNLSRTLESLRESGFTIIALDGEADTLLEDEPLTGAVALVMGSEGKGLRELTRTKSDRMVKIATGGSLNSLNVSNAAAIALHLAAMRRRKK